MQSYISTSTAVLLTGEAPQRIREKIAGGVYETRKQSGGRGGNGGESYQIAVSSLPQEAQILYYAQCDNARDEKSRTFSSNSKKKSHFADFLTEQTLDFVLHRFFCSLAEMHTDDIGCFADLLSHSRARGTVGCGIVHSKSSCK